MPIFSYDKALFVNLNRTSRTLLVSLQKVLDSLKTSFSSKTELEDVNYISKYST